MTAGIYVTVHLVQAGGNCWYVCDCTFGTYRWVTAGALRTVVKADMKQ